MIPIVILVVMLCFGVVYTVARMRFPLEMVLPVQGPAFKNILGWATLLYGVLLTVAYAVQPTSPVDLALAIGGIVVGAGMLLSPSYNEMSDARKKETDRRIIIVTALLAVYVVVSLLLAEFVDRQVFTAFQLTCVSAVVVWAIWRVVAHGRA